MTAASRKRSSAPSSVIAVIESGGLNVLHSDFKLARGQKLVFPPGMPKTKWLSLPKQGTFEQQVQEVTSGAFGELKPNRLYWIRGTRLGLFVPDRAVDVFADRFHATGTVSSAIGRKHGTNPEALAIFVPDGSEHAWEWLAKQSWIDAISTSYYTLIGGESESPTCPEYRSMRTIFEAGRLTFSSSGNAEQAGVAHTPAGSPYTYQVGGVDDQGHTYVPGVSGTEQSVTPTRPYETGDRFSFPAADSESLDGSMDFGGTSGATPSTAGRAVELLHYARSLIGSKFSGAQKGALAIAAKEASLPSRGPLKDGRLGLGEFVNLLHHVAVPAEPASPVRYLVEGYGALNDQAIERAKAVLRGKVAEPSRPDEDAMHDQVESARPLFFPGARCG